MSTKKSFKELWNAPAGKYMVIRCEDGVSNRSFADARDAQEYANLLTDRGWRHEVQGTSSAK
jgi:hypothetical protein